MLISQRALKATSRSQVLDLISWPGSFGRGGDGVCCFFLAGREGVVAFCVHVFICDVFVCDVFVCVLFY